MPVICLVKKGSFTLVGVCDGSGRGFTEVQWGTKSNMVYNFKVQVSWGWGGWAEVRTPFSEAFIESFVQDCKVE